MSRKDYIFLIGYFYINLRSCDDKVCHKLLFLILIKYLASRKTKNLQSNILFSCIFHVLNITKISFRDNPSVTKNKENFLFSIENNSQTTKNAFHSSEDMVNSIENDLSLANRWNPFSNKWNVFLSFHDIQKIFLPWQLRHYFINVLSICHH